MKTPCRQGATEEQLKLIKLVADGAWLDLTYARNHAEAGDIGCAIAAVRRAKLALDQLYKALLNPAEQQEMDDAANGRTASDIAAEKLNDQVMSGLSDAPVEDLEE